MTQANFCWGGGGGGEGWWGKGGVGDITIMGIAVWLHACYHGVNER